MILNGIGWAIAFIHLQQACDYGMRKATGAHNFRDMLLLQPLKPVTGNLLIYFTVTLYMMEVCIVIPAY